MPTVPNKSLFLRQTKEKRHEIPVDPDDPDMVMEVWIRDISFLDIQRAAQEMFSVGKDGEVAIDLESYWGYAFSHWVTKTNPELTPEEMMNLNGFVGEQLSRLLPNPQQLAEMMQGGFQSGDSQK